MSRPITRTCTECGRDGFKLRRGLCSACYSRWRRQDPVVAEGFRAASRRWKAEHPERVKAQHRAYAADPANRGTCHGCGGLMGLGTFADGFCATCTADRVHLRRMELVELWSEGLAIRQIADYFGWTANHMNVEIVHARRAGYNLPYRYRVVRGRRVRDAVEREAA